MEGPAVTVLLRVKHELIVRESVDECPMTYQ